MEEKPTIPQIKKAPDSLNKNIGENKGTGFSAPKTNPQTQTNNFKRPVAPVKPIPNGNTVNSAAKAVKDIPNEMEDDKDINPKEDIKVSQEEQADNQPKKKSKVKVIIIICVLALALIAGALVTFFVFLSPNNQKLTPPEVFVHNLSNQTIIYVQENKNATSYEFFIQRAGGGPVNHLTSTSNSVSIVSLLSTPGDYVIWARYVGKTEKTTSEISTKYAYKYTKQISTPTVNKNTDKLVWTKLTGAKEYRVYYGANSEGPLYFVVDQPSDDVYTVEFSFERIKEIEPGRYNLKVQAIAETPGYYTDSELCSEIIYDNVRTLANVSSAIFNTATNKLTINVDPSKTFVTKFDLVINGGQVNGCLQASSLASSYVFDLTPYITAQSITTVTDVKVKAVGDGSEYIIDSSFVAATLV